MTMLAQRKTFKAFFASIDLADFSFYMLDEDNLTVQVYPMFLHRLSKSFIKNIHRLIATGIPQKIDHGLIYLDKKVQKKPSPKSKKPKPLTMDHLGVCFVPILVCLGLSSISFIAELITQHFWITSGSALIIQFEFYSIRYQVTQIHEKIDHWQCTSYEDES